MSVNARVEVFGEGAKDAALKIIEKRSKAFDEDMLALGDLGELAGKLPAWVNDFDSSLRVSDSYGTWADLEIKQKHAEISYLRLAELASLFGSVPTVFVSQGGSSFFATVDYIDVKVGEGHDFNSVIPIAPVRVVWNPGLDNMTFDSVSYEFYGQLGDTPVDVSVHFSAQDVRNLAIGEVEIRTVQRQYGDMWLKSDKVTSITPNTVSEHLPFNDGTEGAASRWQVINFAMGEQRRRHVVFWALQDDYNEPSAQKFFMHLESLFPLEVEA